MAPSHNAKPKHATIIYLIRHAQTKTNKNHVLQGRVIEGELTEEGERQAEILRKWVSSKEISFVYHSPLARARRTAQIAFEGKNIIEHAGVIEQDTGELSGKTFGQAVEFLSSKGVHLKLDEFMGLDEGDRKYFCQYCAIAKGETCQQVFERGVAAIREIATKHSGETVAIISHGFFNRILICGLLGLPFENESFARVRQANTCINRIVVEGDRITVDMINDASHLNGESRTAA